MKRHITLLLQVVIITWFSAAFGQTLDKTKLDQFFDRLAEKNQAMGSLVIVKDGNILYSRTIGYSQVNGNEKKPATATTKYRIGSITKTYTAVMIFQLVEEGKLKLTDTLDKFFPQIPNASRITIGQILAHRSGIHNVEPDGAWGKQARTKDEVIARIAQGQPDFEPDARHQYSNAGYVLLSYIVEKAGGKPYPEALKERIAAKIGLKDTYLGVGNTDPGKNEALSYSYIGGWREAAEVDPSITSGAGAILSTPADMAKFIHALFELKLISQESLNQMKTMRDGEGMGMEPFSFAGKTLYGHTGGSFSSGAWLSYYPEEKLAFAYTTNMKIYPVANIISGVIDIYYRRPFQIPAFETLAVKADILDKYVGVYAHPEAPVKMTITRKDATLFVQPGNESPAALDVAAPDKFQLAGGKVVFEFDAVKKQMTLKRAGTFRVLTKEK
jgi:CubicO group peptidase (beta-lactamase class C family)